MFVLFIFYYRGSVSFILVSVRIWIGVVWLEEVLKVRCSKGREAVYFLLCRKMNFLRVFLNF